MGAALLSSTIITIPIPIISTAQAHHTARANKNKSKSLNRRIVVDLSDRVLRAWQGKTLVYMMPVAIGKRKTPTITGRYRIKTKLRTTRMRGEDYDIAKVPYTMYYHAGYAIHGAPWRKKFGIRASHGCVNLSVKHARMLYRWAKVGTPVVVRK